MSAEIHFSCDSGGRTVSVTRGDKVPDDFWRKLRSEWGQSGSNPNRRVEIPVELFIGRKSWLRSAAKQFSVIVHVDDSVRKILEKDKSDQAKLDSARLGATQMSEVEVRSLLSTSRYKRDLRPFQIRDLCKVLALAHGANFSVPGAGKTAVELAVYEAERQRGRVSRMLIVGPISSFESWTKEPAKCLSPAPAVFTFSGGKIPVAAEILVTNYQRLESSFEALASWMAQEPTLLVLDEAHRMKRGWDGQWGAACLRLAILAERRDVLTGTPAPQHPRDLVALLDFLWPAQALRILPGAALAAQPDPSDVARVTPAIKQLFVRTTKAELELREPDLLTIRVPMGNLHSQIYESLKSNFSKLVKSQRERIEIASWGDIAMYLLEAATNPGLLPAGSSSDDPIEFRHPPLPIPDDSTLYELISDFSAFETPEKFIQLARIVKEKVDRGRKVLVWSNFVRNLRTLEKMFALYQPALIHGGVPYLSGSSPSERTRESELDRFRFDDQCMVLLANPAALGEGVSLHQVCHEAIYLERTFNAGQYLQSVDRIHRLGLDPSEETRVTFLVSEDTIDEVAFSRIDQKARSLGIMLDDPSIATMSLPDEEAVGRPIDLGDKGDLEALFAHLRGD